jgi:predicted GNAT family N-acyltransferase
MGPVILPSLQINGVTDSGYNALADTEILTTGFAENRELIFGIRKAVFVIEQSVPEEIEMDDLDAVAQHVLAFVDGTAVGTGRITAEGRIGRMAVLREYRGRGVGRDILLALVEIGRSYHIDRLCLSAQCHAIPFYERMGFVAQGGVYEEAGIPHRWMEQPRTDA